MGDWLDLVIFFVGSGLAFFLGVAFVLLGLITSIFVAGRKLALARNLVVMVGGILVAISATPFEWWVYALLAVVTCVWLPLEWFTGWRSSTILIYGARLSVLAVWLLALGLELPFHFMPRLPPLEHPTLFLIGDSVSAGMKEADPGTWPKVLMARRAIDLRDYSRMGATVGSARKQADRIGEEPGLVLLEIGGNDVLGSTTAEEFETRLESLLAQVCRPTRVVVMLELPLPPFRNRIGIIQRRLAAKYDVVLIPKRVFITVLTKAGATMDGIHLSSQGHALMADVMWEMLAPAFGE